MQPLGHDNQSQVGVGTQLLNNAVAAAKFLAHIPEKAAGFVGKQATAVYSSLPLTHKKTEEGVNHQEKKAVVDNPKTSRSFTGTIGSAVSEAGTKIKDTFLALKEAPGKIGKKTQIKPIAKAQVELKTRVSVDDFEKKLNEVQVSTADAFKALRSDIPEHLTLIREDIAAQQQNYANLTCDDPQLVQQMNKSLELAKLLLEDPNKASAWLKEKGDVNSLQLRGLVATSFQDATAFNEWQAAHAELADISNEASKQALNEAETLLGMVKEAFDAIENNEFEEANDLLNAAREGLDEMTNISDQPLAHIQEADKGTISFAIKKAQGLIQSKTG